MSEKSTMTVRDQYESFPYPPRDPEDEKKRLLKTYFGDLDYLSHFCYGGRNLFKKKLNILDAGCGTGDTVVMLAELLKNTGSKITALDISRSSLDVAEKRCNVRGLTNVKFIQGSLLDLPKMDLEKFDYIVCCGVLHHLEDPVLGLNCLKEILKGDGIIAIMVYAKYGRTAVYMTQQIMKKINKGETDVMKKIENTKKILQGYHDAHWNSLNLLKDDVTMGDAGLYDLYLHSQDRAYTISELFDWIKDECGLNVSHIVNGFLYDPFFYIGDKEIWEKVLNFSQKEKLFIGELLNGQIPKHIVYIGKGKKEQIDYLSDENRNLYYPFLRQSLDQIDELGNDMNLTVRFSGIEVNIEVTDFNKFAILNLKGNKTPKDIIDEACVKFNISKEEAERKWKNLAKLLIKYEMMVFKCAE